MTDNTKDASLKTSTINKVNDAEKSVTSLDELPVLAKDNYYLSRLERELARAAVSKNKKSTHNSGQKSNQDNAIAKKRAQYGKIKTRSQEAVQARIDSIPSDLPAKLNLDLPVSQRAEDLVQAIIDNQVIIVAGETGSGKTTQLPKLAMLAGRGITGQIGHTQPRRLAARSVANRISEELGEQLGNTVSFKIRFNEQGSAQSVVKLMTDGILLAELGHDRFLSKYDTIIIDEAHERSLNIDFIMGYLKKMLPKRPDLKVIITSATLDTKRFSEYFSHYDTKLKRQVPAPIFNVEGRSFPVEVRYRPLTDEPVNSSEDDSYDDFEENLPRAVVAAVEECFSDAQNKGHADQADILIFAATEAEIREMQEVLERHGPRHTEVLRSNASVLNLLNGIDSAVIVCGHTHIPRTVTLSSGQMVINSGSVGYPAYEDDLPIIHQMQTYSPHANYALISCIETEQGRRWHTEHVKVAYNHEAAADLALKNGRKDWAYALRTGRVV